MPKFKRLDIVRIKGEDENGINSRGIILAIEEDKYWVSNLNMPFAGTISDFFSEYELEKVERKGAKK